MTFDDYVLIALTLLLFKPVNQMVLCYSKSLFDLYREIDLFNSNSQLFLKGLDKRFGNRWIPPLALTALSFLAYPFIQWELLDPLGILRYFICLIGALLSWNPLTEDIDLATGNSLYRERALLLASVIALFFYPGFLILFLYVYVHHLRGWHNHPHLLIQMLQMFLAFLAATVIYKTMLPVQTGLSAPLFLFLAVVGSLYFQAGVAKIKLGKHWYSWAYDNRLHYLVLSSYLWGWLRNWSKTNRLALSNGVKRWECTLQFGTLLCECGWLLGAFDKHLTEGLCLLNCFFHLFVFLLSGLFFWQNILINLSLWGILLILPDPVSASLFNPVSGVVFACLQLFNCFVYSIWVPLSMSWWDTPFIARIHWEVVGVSGKRYGLYNDFMRPHEKFFGRNKSIFLSPYPVMTFQLGETFYRYKRDAIIATQGDLERLETCKKSFGKIKKNPLQERIHDQYLQLFFYNFNKGKPKRVCPTWLRAPGDQCYYWGLRESFQGQEPVATIWVIYREEYFHEETIIPVMEKLLKVIPIPR